MDQKGMLLAHMELGNAFIGQGMYEQAIDHFSKCATGFGPVDLVHAYNNLGVACTFLGRLDEAKVHLENAVRLADETAQPRSKAYALTSLAEVLIKTGSLAQAREHCFRSLEILTELDDKIGMSNAYANLAQAELASNDLTSSQEHCSESISVLVGLDCPKTLEIRKKEYSKMMVEASAKDRDVHPKSD